jgi:transcriptional regulator with XRE-family HTH domain
MIGHTIKNIRKSLRMKQTELSEKTGISKSYISMIESGQKIPTLDTLQCLSIALGTPLPLLEVFMCHFNGNPIYSKEEFENIISKLRESLYP